MNENLNVSAQLLKLEDLELKFEMNGVNVVDRDQICYFSFMLEVIHEI